MTIHRQFSLPREYTRKWRGVNINFRRWGASWRRGKTTSSYIGNKDIALGIRKSPLSHEISC
jgi:hypothetical protein